MIFSILGLFIGSVYQHTLIKSLIDSGNVSSILGRFYSIAINLINSVEVSPGNACFL